MNGSHHLDSGPQDPRASLCRLQETARQASARQQQEQAREAAARRLQEAARFAGMHAAGPLLNKRMGTGKAALLVRFELPGVLRVLDPITGRELARSEAGAPDRLAADFDPLAGLIGRPKA